ncbi:MAG: hypothetical protein PUJ49_06855 [bacterium]|nr:hypothetical protein [bacterium]
MIKVCKFGGSSVATKEGYFRLKQIIEADEERKAIIVSAPGKRFSGDEKITDLLYYAFSVIGDKGAYSETADKIIARFSVLADFVGFRRIKKEVEKFFLRDGLFTDEKTFVSRGEYFSAKIVAEYLNGDFLDSKDCLIFDYNGKLNFAETKVRLKKLINPNKLTVIPGFYGGFFGGQINLLFRGASDYSGACIAAALGAREYENFTDVDGIFEADPKIYEKARVVPFLTFYELSELSASGAKVLEEHTVQPLVFSCIPLVVKNTFSEEEGTRVEKTRRVFTGKPIGITGKMGLIVFSVALTSNVEEAKTIRGISSFLAEKSISTEVFFVRRKAAIFVVKKEKIDKCFFPSDGIADRSEENFDKRLCFIEKQISRLYGVAVVCHVGACSVSVVGECPEPTRERAVSRPKESNVRPIFSQSVEKYSSVLYESFEKNGSEVICAHYSEDDNVLDFYLKCNDLNEAVRAACSVVFG